MAARINAVNNLVTPPITNPYDYSPSTGIQPHQLVALLRSAYPDANIVATQAPSAAAGIRMLRTLVSSPGYQVIVDYLSDNQANPMPDGAPNAIRKIGSFAHFARVVGFTGNNIVLAQSVNPQTNGNT